MNIWKDILNIFKMSLLFFETNEHKAYLYKTYKKIHSCKSFTLKNDSKKVCTQ